MGKAPDKCPMCGERRKWNKIDSSRKGFSLGKAAVGGILLGPVGLAGGIIGNRHESWICGTCGFQHDYVRS